MKKSEMIKLLKKDLEEIQETSGISNDITNTDTLDLILDLLESRGVLPPFNHYIGHGPSSLWTDNLRCYYTWEPEDE